MVVNNKSKYNIDYLKRKIDKSLYVSFDMFDTLIKRNVSEPTDVFDIVEREYNRREGCRLHDWKRMRINAEVCARIESNNYEPNIEEIYDQINLSDDEKEKLKDLELEWEVRICQQNVDFYPVYQYAKEHAKKIFVTSNMYLHVKTLKMILKNANIDVDGIYISNEKRFSKNSGELFRQIIKENNIDSGQLLHIGDSVRADFLGANRVGVRAAIVPTKVDNLRYFKGYKPKTLTENIILSYINNNLGAYSNIYSRIGFEILGVVLYGYALWLERELTKKKNDKVFFLAREGALLKRAFEIVSNSKRIKSKYLYVSRRSTRGERLIDVENLEEACERCSIKNNADFETLWLDLGLVDTKGKPNYKLMHKIGVSPEGSIRKWEGFDRIKTFVQENASNELSHLTGYLRQEGFGGKLAIADIGWRGTMQKSLASAAEKAGINVDINGYYVGLILDSEEVDSHKGRHGYLFYGGDMDNKAIRGFVGLFESMFLADHGSTIKYIRKGETYQPVFAEFEYSEAESKVWRKMQEGAIDFVKEVNEKFSDLMDGLTPKFVSFGLIKLGHSPSLEDVNLLGDISFLDTKVKTIAKPRKLATYVVNPKQLMRDLDDCRWKVGFLKRLCKIKINYFWIYRILAKKK